MIISNEALLVRDQRTLVFVAEDRFAKWHYVEVGREMNEWLKLALEYLTVIP